MASFQGEDYTHQAFVTLMFQVYHFFDFYFIFQMVCFSYKKGKMILKAPITQSKGGTTTCVQYCRILTPVKVCNICFEENWFSTDNF